jgi:cholesterol oxidase
VILAAGTLGSTEILLHSRRHGLKLSKSLGMKFSGNGDFILAETVDTPKNLHPTVGPSITAAADFSSGKHRVLIEELGSLPIFGGLFGLVHGRTSEPQKHALRYLCMGNDSADGVFSLNAFGGLHLDWNGKKKPRALRLLRGLAQAAEPAPEGQVPRSPRLRQEERRGPLHRPSPRRLPDEQHEQG